MRLIRYCILSLGLLMAGKTLTAQVTLVAENFNGAGTPVGWQKINNSTGGLVASADWIIRPDGYTYSSLFVTAETFHSNDNSPFYLTNSDAQYDEELDEDVLTQTILQSPTFSTVGYSTVTLRFYHYFREYSTDSGFVEVSTNNITWTKAATYTYPEESRDGTSTSFVQKTVDLSSYSGSANLYIRFRYYAEFGYYWAIDNVLVTGSTSAPCVVNNWEGTLNSAWEEPLNWSCGSVPGPATEVQINAGKLNYPIINSTATCKSLNAAPGATVQVLSGKSLTIAGP